MALWTWLTERHVPERVCWQAPEATHTYADLHARVGAAQAWLDALGAAPGEVVALQLSPEAPFLELFLATIASGLIALPLNDRYTDAETHWLLTDARARLIVRDRPLDDAPCPVHTPPPLAGPAPAPEDRAPWDTIATILYTSGTTGRAKAAPLTHANIAATVGALDEAWAWRAEDRLLHALPLFHVHGLFVAALGALRAGATVLRAHRFEPEAIAARIEAESATILMGVPTFYARLLAAPGVTRRALAGLRLVTSGSAPLPAAQHAAFAARFGHQIVERYGMTEIGIVLSNRLEAPKAGSIGRPLPGVALRIVAPEGGADLPPGEVGELWIRGPSVFSGYRDLPTEAALTEGWMRTGDLGYLDADGDVTLVGRRSAMVIVGGFNVYPSEIEAVLAALPGVAECAVFGVPDPDLGERLVAFAVSTQNPPPELAGLRHALRARLTPYKIPTGIRWVDSLPRNAMGKVLVSAMREACARTQDDPAASE